MTWLESPFRRRLGIVAGLLVLALFLYWRGISTPLIGLFFLGAAAEGAFWVVLLWTNWKRLRAAR